MFKGQFIEIVTLKSPEWLAETGAKPGVWIPYDLPEMGIEGPAKVLSIGPCPAIKPGLGRVVLSTYHRFANNVMEMHVEGDDGSGEVVEVTANHPVFSVDRGEWVEVGELDVHRGVEVPGVAGRFLEVPGHFARVGFDRDDRGQIPSPVDRQTLAKKTQTPVGSRP